MGTDDIALIIILIALLVNNFLLTRYFLMRKKRESVPYATRNAMEDVLARNTNSRIALQNLRDLVEVAEWNLEVEGRLLGQIRSGEYDKDQPAAPRRPPSEYLSE